MASDFSRTLALLRREKKISQRTAASDLEVSQALLSHYENGLREPGLSFVVRAANYYQVSSDYLLGRSMSREGGAPSPESIPDVSNEKGNVLTGSVATMLHKKMIVNSVAVLFDLVGKSGSKQLTSEISTYLSLALYKVFRYMYAADTSSTDMAFRTDAEQFDYLCDAQMRLAELRMQLAAKGEAGHGVQAEPVHMPSLDLAEIAQQYPGVSQSLLTLLQMVTDNVSVFDIKPTKKAEQKNTKKS